MCLYLRVLHRVTYEDAENIGQEKHWGGQDVETQKVSKRAPHCPPAFPPGAAVDLVAQLRLSQCNGLPYPAQKDQYGDRAWATRSDLLGPLTTTHPHH